MDERFEQEVAKLTAATLTFIKRQNMLKVWKTSSALGGFVRWLRVNRESQQAFETEFLEAVADRDVVESEVRRMIRHTNTALSVHRLAATIALVVGFTVWQRLPCD